MRCSEVEFSDFVVWDAIHISYHNFVRVIMFKELHPRVNYDQSQVRATSNFLNSLELIARSGAIDLQGSLLLNAVMAFCLSWGG